MAPEGAFHIYIFCMAPEGAFHIFCMAPEGAFHIYELVTTALEPNPEKGESEG
jgi:hypothetical protein